MLSNARKLIMMLFNSTAVINLKIVYIYYSTKKTDDKICTLFNMNNKMLIQVFGCIIKSIEARLRIYYMKTP
jgi:hypothetical protein